MGEITPHRSVVEMSFPYFAQKPPPPHLITLRNSPSRRLVVETSFPYFAQKPPLPHRITLQKPPPPHRTTLHFLVLKVQKQNKQ